MQRTDTAPNPIDRDALRRKYREERDKRLRDVVYAMSTLPEFQLG